MHPCVVACRQPGQACCSNPCLTRAALQLSATLKTASNLCLVPSCPVPSCRAQVVCPGAYRCVCVRLKLYNLAVSAIVKSEALAELEGASSAAGVDARAAPVFRVLRQLVHAWLAEASQGQNRRAPAPPQGTPVLGRQLMCNLLASG